jgi:hypothetical protein
VTPERNYFEAGSNSVAKSGVVCGMLAVPLGWIQVVGFVFALGFGGLAIVLGAISLLRAGRLPPVGAGIGRLLRSEPASPSSSGRSLKVSAPHR